MLREISRRTLIAALVALVGAVLFVRLGIWQLHRLTERRAFNAQLESRLRLPPVSPVQLPADTALAKYRRVQMTGTFDFDHQIVITGRSRAGAPGVHIITPFRPDSGGRTVLVNRGWVYSPDASTIDLSSWHEPEHVTIDGYVTIISDYKGTEPRSAANPMAWRQLDWTRVTTMLPYPVEPFYIVALAHGEGSSSSPKRLELPALDEGPHKSYAIQWFTFAAIALYAVGYLFWIDRHGSVAPVGRVP